MAAAGGGNCRAEAVLIGFAQRSGRIAPTREVPMFSLVSFRLVSFRFTSFRIASAIAMAATAASFTSPALAQEDTDQRLGTVHFATSCNETAQRRFDSGMRYQHSFWYAQAKEIFEDVLKADPSCAIAYWGIALSLLSNPHSAPTPASQPEGLAALQKGKALGAK